MCRLRFFNMNWGLARLGNLINVEQLRRPVQLYVIKVYLITFLALVVLALGVYIHLLCEIGGLLTMLTCTGGMLSVSLIPLANEVRRCMLFMVAVLCYGASAGSFFDFILTIDHGIFISMHVWTALVFFCFFVATCLSARKGWIYFTGLLLSCVSISIWFYSIESIFGGSTPPPLELYLRFLVFLMYVVVNNEAAIRQASATREAELDCVKHAMTLFTCYTGVVALQLSIGWWVRKIKKI